jgi:hypothetical protein
MTPGEFYAILGKQKSVEAVRAGRRFLTGESTFTRDEVLLISLMESHQVAVEALARLVR